MSVDAGTVYSSIRVRLGDLDNDLKGVYARLNQLESNITKTTVPAKKNFTDMFKAVVTGQAVLQLAQKGFSLLTGAIKDSIRVATESQEMISKYNVVFEGMGSASEEAATRFADSFDLAGATAKEMLSNTGNLLQGFGATKEESLKLSEQVNVLASDLASFTNNQGGAKVASEALTKALLGEREQAKTLGIAILESDVQTRLAANGQSDLTGTALKLAKAQVTLELITEQAKNSIGDYARTANSASNIQKAAAESTKEFQIQLGTFLSPAVTVLAKAWGTVASKIADVMKSHNDLRDGQKADVLDNDSLEKKILFLKEERKQIEKNLQIGKEKAKQYGYDYTAQEAQAKAQIKLNEEGIKAAERQITIRDDLAKAQVSADEKAKKDAQDKEELEKRISEAYSNSRDIVIDALESQKSEYDKIQDQIDTLQSTPWAKGELEQDRLAAIEALKQKQRELLDEELAANDEARAAAKERRDTIQSTIDKVVNLGNVEASGSEQAKNAIIEEIKALKLVPEQEQELIDKTEEYYKALKKKEAASEFMKNTSEAIGTGIELFSAFADLINQLNKNEVDEQKRKLDDETDALSEALDERQRLESEALAESQEAEDEALKYKQDAALAEIDAELQAALYAAGLTKASTIEQLQSELDAAIAAGDATLIAEAQDALEKATIEKQYADQKKALEEQQAAEKKALDEKQAAESLALQKKQKAEEKKLEEEQARKLAKIQYDAALVAWKMQLALATAMAAQSIIGALSAFPFWPLNAGSVAAATGIGLLQVAAVSAAKPVLAYATGGIVPGTSYSGDNIQANVNSGEMILTGQQQSRLFALLNGETANGTLPTGQINATIVMQLDSGVIAQSTIQLVNNGKYLIKARSII